MADSFAPFSFLYSDVVLIAGGFMMLWGVARAPVSLRGRVMVERRRLGSDHFYFDNHDVAIPKELLPGIVRIIF